MAPWSFIVRAIFTFENLIIQQILRSPGFHRAVGKIHRRVHERKYGRDPHEPLRPGEATEDPGLEKRGFGRFFLEELKNQFRGNPTNLPPPPRPPKP